MEDNFFNIIWRWSYTNGKISKLVSFCSHCDFRVYPKDADLYDNRAKFVCDNCGAHLQEFSDRYDVVENLIIRKIDHKLRTGTWNTTVLEHGGKVSNS